MATILVIDDDLDIRCVVATALEFAGHTVLQAGDGAGALSTLEMRPEIELAVLDLMLPHMSGWEILDLIRATPRTQHLPVLLLSAVGDAPNRTRGLNQGADDFIAKPFDPSELVARVEGVLRRTAVKPMPLAAGDLADASLGETLQTLAALGLSGTLTLAAADQEGSITIGTRGWVDARIGSRTGAAAVLTMLGTREGRFAFTRSNAVGGPSLGSPLEGLLLEAAWLDDELAAAPALVNWALPIEVVNTQAPTGGYEELPWAAIAEHAASPISPRDMVSKSPAAPRATELAIRLGLASGWLRQASSTGAPNPAIILVCHDDGWPSLRSLLIKIPNAALGADAQKVKQKAILAQRSTLWITDERGGFELRVFRIHSHHPKDVPDLSLGPSDLVVGWNVSKDVAAALRDQNAGSLTLIGTEPNQHAAPSDLDSLQALLQQSDREVVGISGSAAGHVENLA